MKRLIILTVLCAFLLSGCRAGETRRELLDQTRKAAVTLHGPTARDIEANCVELQGWYGLPKIDKPYSPEASKALRAESKYYRDKSLWLKIKLLLKLILLGGGMEALLSLVSVWAPGIVGVVSAAWALWKKWQADKKVMAGYQASAKIMQTVRNGQPLGVAKIKSILSDTQAIYNCGPGVIADIKKLIKDGKLRYVPSQPREPVLDEGLNDGGDALIPPA